MTLRNQGYVSPAGGPMTLRLGWPHDPAKIAAGWPHEAANWHPPRARDHDGSEAFVRSSLSDQRHLRNAALATPSSLRASQRA